MALRLDQRHRNIVLDNLTASFPEHDPAWVEDTARKVFEHVAQVATEIPPPGAPEPGAGLRPDPLPRPR